MVLRERFYSLGLECFKSRVLNGNTNEGKQFVAFKFVQLFYSSDASDGEKGSVDVADGSTEKQTKTFPREKATLGEQGKVEIGLSMNHVTLHTGETIYEPQEPGPDDCCGKGCQECVWTQYWDSKIEYNNVVSKVKGVERERTAFELFEERLAREKNL
jgi:hypothetical protein